MGGLCTKCNDECVPLMDSTSPRYHACGRSGDQDIEMSEEFVFDDIEMSEEFVFDDIEMSEEFVFDACCNCGSNGDCSDCKCSTHRCTFCQSQNCLFRKQIQDAIDSMRTEQTRDALNELMAVQGIANLNQAVLRNRFRRVYNTRACSKCQTSRKYDSACSDVACTYKKELEKAIQRMDADKGKTALNEILNSNSLNKVEDAVFWNVCNDRVPEWYGEEITRLDEFRDKVTGLALLEVNKNHSSRPDKILIFRNSNDSNVTRICYEPFLGEFKLRARQYDLDDEDFRSFIDFKKDSCMRTWHEQFMQSQQPQPTCNTNMTDNLKYIIGKIGTTENGDEFKVDEANKPEAHKLLKKMYKAAEKNKKERYCLLPFFKSIGVLVTLLISFIGVAFTSNVRQAHIRILVEMFIDFQQQQKYPQFVFRQCTDFYGKKVIHATHERVKEVIEEDYPKETSFVIALINNNISRFLDTDKVCGIASDLGKENMMKTSIDLLVIWSILQITFILSYETLHLRSAVKPNHNLYLKAIVIEVVGGFVPMILSIGTGCIIQHEMDRPTVLYVTMVCVTAFVTSALFRFLLNLIPTKTFCGQCWEKCLNSKCKTGCVISLVLSISTLLACMILMYLHHKSPKIFKYFDPL